MTAGASWSILTVCKLLSGKERSIRSYSPSVCVYIYCTYKKEDKYIDTCQKNMASGNLIGCKVHGPALAYSSMDGWVCIMFSKKPSI